MHRFWDISKNVFLIQQIFTCKQYGAHRSDSQQPNPSDDLSVDKHWPCCGCLYVGLESRRHTHQNSMQTLQPVRLEAGSPTPTAQLMRWWFLGRCSMRSYRNSWSKMKLFRSLYWWLAGVQSDVAELNWTDTVQFLCAIAECFAHLSHGLDVCLSVRPSHSWSVSKRCMLGSRHIHWAAPRTLVYCDKISCSWVKGFLSNYGVKEGYPL